MNLFARIQDRPDGKQEFWGFFIKDGQPCGRGAVLTPDYTSSDIEYLWERLHIALRLILLAAFAGFVDPNCTIEKVCVPGYTATVRPPASYTTKLKKQQMAALGLPGDPNQYEEDHIISLELCGNPRDPRNLIPELWPQARKKDVMENRLHKAVCAGKMTLEEAQKQVVTYE